MKRLIIITAVMAISAGCQTQNTQQVKIDAQKRWNHTRAQVLCGVGQEQLKAGQLEQARIKAMEALSLEEGFVEARMLLGKVYIEQGCYGAAIVELTKAMQQLPSSPDAIYLLGVAQEKNGQLEEALASYRHAQVLGNNSLPAIMAVGEVLAAMGRTREAQLHVESYLSLADNEPGMFELAGRLATMTGKHEQAATYFQQAYDLDSKNLRYKEALGRALFMAGKFQPAMEILKDLSETKDYASCGWVYSMLGDCYLAVGRPANARDAYQAAAEISPSSATAWTDLAKAALALGDLARAIIAANQALSLDAKCLDATLVLGYALVRDGQAVKAVGVLKQAAGDHKDSGTLLCLLGCAYAGEGDEIEAIKCYSAALKLEPGNPLARELFSGTAVRKLSRLMATN